MRVTTARDPTATEVQLPTIAAAAFGLHVRLPDGLLIDALRPATVGGRRPATVVTVEPNPIAIWQDGAVERVRETLHKGRVIWSVDVDRDRGFQLQAAGLATIVVAHDGLAVRCAPARRSAGARWSGLVPAQALPLAATLRHLEVLHASAVTLDGGALVFCGEPGVGKSSLAAQLVLHGAGLLSDDAVAVDGDLVAHPSTGSVHLRPAELARLDMAARDRLGIGTATRFDGRAVGSVPPAAAAPLAAVYLLERAIDGPTLESVETVNPAALLGSTFNLSVRSPERLLRHLELCARIATGVPLFRIRVTPGVDTVMLAEQVLACR